ncbi:MAG: entericidin A/B family lipoprotein [bacterium]
MRMRTFIAALLLAALGMAGCNTVEGVGKDIERGGERLQDSAEKTRR